MVSKKKEKEYQLAVNEWLQYLPSIGVDKLGFDVACVETDEEGNRYRVMLPVDEAKTLEYVIKNRLYESFSEDVHRLFLKSYQYYSRVYDVAERRVKKPREVYEKKVMVKF